MELNRKNILNVLNRVWRDNSEELMPYAEFRNISKDYEKILSSGKNINSFSSPFIKVLDNSPVDGATMSTFLNIFYKTIHKEFGDEIKKLFVHFMRDVQGEYTFDHFCNMIVDYAPPYKSFDDYYKAQKAVSPTQLVNFAFTWDLDKYSTINWQYIHNSWYAYFIDYINGEI